MSKHFSDASFLSLDATFDQSIRITVAAVVLSTVGMTSGKCGADQTHESSDQRRLVYSVENTGADFLAPDLPGIADLPSVAPLTDPLMWSDGSGRVSNFDEWSRRHAEIKSEIEHDEIGEKPARPENITANYDDGKLTVNVTVNGETLILTSVITLPSGDGPFPAVIGIGFGSGSLPADIFDSRNIAKVAFNFREVMSHTQKRGNERINKLYPELTHMGAHSAWS